MDVVRLGPEALRSIVRAERRHNVGIEVRQPVKDDAKEIGPAEIVVRPQTSVDHRSAGGRQSVCPGRQSWAASRLYVKSHGLNVPTRHDGIRLQAMWHRVQMDGTEDARVL